MIPVRYYLTPTSTLSLLRGKVQHEFITINETESIGWVDFDSAEIAGLQTFLESQSDVVSLGTVLHPIHPTMTGVTQHPAFKTAGVTESDNTISALEKVQKQFGGFRVRI